jgi:hypothetical protein
MEGVEPRAPDGDETGGAAGSDGARGGRGRPDETGGGDDQASLGDFG